MTATAEKRFMTEPSLGFAAQDTNLFRYVGNAPTMAIDPDGLKTLLHTEQVKHPKSGETLGIVNVYSEEASEDFKGRIGIQFEFIPSKDRKVHLGWIQHVQKGEAEEYCYDNNAKYTKGGTPQGTGHGSNSDPSLDVQPVTPPAHQLATAFTEWTDSTGKHKVKAKFKGITDDGKARLEKEDGTCVDVDLSKLSNTDLGKLLPPDNRKQITWNYDHDGRKTTVNASALGIESDPTEGVVIVMRGARLGAPDRRVPLDRLDPKDLNRAIAPHWMTNPWYGGPANNKDDILPLDGGTIDDKRWDKVPRPQSGIFDAPDEGKFIAQLVDAEDGTILFNYSYSYRNREFQSGAPADWVVKGGKRVPILRENSTR